MRAIPFVLATVILGIGIAGCDSQAKRETPAEKTAGEKVREALATQQAEDEKHRSELRAAATEGKLTSINRVCPVTGLPVDPAIAPVTVEVLIVNPPEYLAIGVANEEAAEAVRQNPERYTAAARHNRQARSTTTVGH